jgi:hypothetical protein
MNWVVPFLALLSVRAKCTHRVLKTIAILLLCGHWLDLYLLLMPAIWKTPHLGFYEIAMPAGCVAFAFLVFVRSFNRAEPVPLNDPILAFEQLHAIDHQEPADTRIHGVAQ